MVPYVGDMNYALAELQLTVEFVGFRNWVATLRI
jgi:hypothetical protein